MNLKKFLLHFPPPNFLNVPYTGMVFSDSSIRLLVLDRETKHPVYFKEIPLAPGIIQMGKVVDSPALSKILQAERKEISSPYVKFSIPDETSYVFTSRVPLIKEKDARESVSFILEENVPLPLGDISFDFAVQSLEQSGNAYLGKVAVSAAATSLVSSYVDAIRVSGFEPISCINESQAVSYAILPKGREGVAVILHLHKQSAGIYVTNGQFVEFSSTMPISQTDSSPDIVKSIKLEIEKAIDYWSARTKLNNEENKLDCYLCGEYEIVKSLPVHLTELANINPILANVWLNAFNLEEYIPEISFENSLRFASSIGLFLIKE